MKGSRPMTPAERQAKRRQRVQEDGGRVIQVTLSPTAARDLDKLLKEYGSITAAVEDALYLAANT